MPLTASADGDVAVNDFLEFKCPGNNITDEGRSVMLQCIGNKQFETRESWPECREPLVCSANDTLPAQDQASLDSGFTCYWADTEEFLSIECNCTDPSKVVEEGGEFPRCRKGGIWEGPLTWPLCVDPPRCNPDIGPPMPVSVNTSGLVGAYSDIFEGDDILFRCNDSIKAISGGNAAMLGNETSAVAGSNDTITETVFKVRCGDKGIWEAPYDEDWPTCEVLPQHQCSVAQDMDNGTIPAEFSPADASVTSVLNDQIMSFKCSNSSLAAVMSDGSRVTEFSFNCSSTGEFVGVEWPDRCELYQDCVASSFPSELHGFNIISGQSSVSQESHLMLECPQSGHIIDHTARTVAGVTGPKCSGPDTFDSMPAGLNASDCREERPCSPDTGPAPPAENGLVCTYTQTQEFQSFTGCTCSDSSLSPQGGSGDPVCNNGTFTEPATWHNCSAPASGSRRKREVDLDDVVDQDYDDNEITTEVIDQDEPHIRSKRAVFANYFKVIMEVQFAQKLPQDRQLLVDTILDMIDGIDGKFYTVEEATWQYKAANNITDDTMKTYLEHQFNIETPFAGDLPKWKRETRCEDCIKFIQPNTCPNELLGLLKTGYSHSKPEKWKEVLGKNKDVNEVTVGSSVDLYCTDYIMKPKRDVWDDDRKDGTLTIICMPHLQFNIPYDTSSWGSCLAKCPEPSKITSTADLVVATDQMTGGLDDELWEGEQVVYRCKNDSLVLDDDPDKIKVKYKCRNTGKYNTPEKITQWPVCTQKPVRPEIKRAIQIMTSKFDMNIDYRNALYGGGSKGDGEATIMHQLMFWTVPGLVVMLVLVVFICCCTRPDSIICKICEPSVKEKPGGGSARRRSARSGRSSARSAVVDEEAGVGDAPDDVSTNNEDVASLQTETEDVPDTEPVDDETVEPEAEDPEAVEDLPEEETPEETPEENTEEMDNVGDDNEGGEDDM